MMRWAINITILVALVAVGGLIFTKPEALKSLSDFWAISVEPGKLSKFHSNLESNCSACHDSYRGVARNQCVVCHAAQTEILKKQNTSFHGSVSSCTGCHFEHQGKDASITKMDHTHLALVLTEMLMKETSVTHKTEYRKIPIYESAKKGYHGTDSALEKTLDCNSCHANQDKHRSLFGSDCSNCHVTDKWTIPAFRHPLPSSRDCSQCHQAPPSHYMMHFKMVSEKVAGVENMKVSQCYACHQTTSWNDIKGVGWYKHH